MYQMWCRIATIALPWNTTVGYNLKVTFTLVNIMKRRPTGYWDL